MSRRRSRSGDEIRRRGECSRPGIPRDEYTYRLRISRFAKVSTLATEQSQDAESSESKLNDVDANLLKRIQKMLKLAQHPNTSEAEAKQAIRASTRMLSAYNLTEADLMAHETTAEQMQRAGHSIVTVRHRDGKEVSLESWSLTVGHAVCAAFNVKFFYTRYTTHDQIDFTFYGLRDNTVTAAMSFEAIFNLALTWASQRQDVRGRSGKNSYLVGMSDSLYRIAKSEKKEEERQAIEHEKRTIEQTERKAKEQENIHRARLNQRQQTKAAKIEDEDEDAEVIFVSFKRGRSNGGEAVAVKMEKVKEEEEHIENQSLEGGDEDDESDGRDGLPLFDGDIDAEDDADVEEMLGDADTERKRFERAFDSQRHEDVLKERSTNAIFKSEDEDDIKPDIIKQNEKPADVKPKAEQDEEAQVPTWQSHAQLTIFKDTASKLAEEYLKTLTTKVKTSKARARTSPYDNDAYRKGAEDAKKVDMKRRRLE